MPSTLSLKTLLNDNTAPAAPELTEAGEGGSVRCLACGHRCVVQTGRAGICRVRFNRDGQLRVPAGYVGSIAIDPIEKKPFYHAYPGTEALSFGMLGCDFHCGYCQNWVTSQALRDDQAVSTPFFLTAERVVQLALEHRCPVLTSTYNEPLITSEWAVEILKLGKQEGLAGAYVSNGNGTPEVLEFIRPCVDLYKVDLKAFEDKTYRRLGGVLANVLETIRLLKQMDFWLEVVTLVVPGLNDGDDELKRMAAFLAGVSPDIPWHVTAFHPDYKMTAPSRTPAETLMRAYEIGKAAGLRFVYPGNLPSQFGDRENTACPDCGQTLIERRGFRVVRNHMSGANCPNCRLVVPGVWQNDPPPSSRGPGLPRRVQIHE